MSERNVRGRQGELVKLRAALAHEIINSERGNCSLRGFMHKTFTDRPRRCVIRLPNSSILVFNFSIRRSPWTASRSPQNTKSLPLKPLWLGKRRDAMLELYFLQQEVEHVMNFEIRSHLESNEIFMHKQRMSGGTDSNHESVTFVCLIPTRNQNTRWQTEITTSEN